MNLQTSRLKKQFIQRILGVVHKRNFKFLGTYHEDIKFIKTPERCFHSVPKCHDERYCSKGSFSTRERFCAFTITFLCLINVHLQGEKYFVLQWMTGKRCFLFISINKNDNICELVTLLSTRVLRVSYAKYSKQAALYCTHSINFPIRVNLYCI